MISELFMLLWMLGLPVVVVSYLLIAWVRKSRPAAPAPTREARAANVVQKK